MYQIIKEEHGFLGIFNKRVVVAVIKFDELSEFMKKVSSFDKYYIEKR